METISFRTGKKYEVVDITDEVERAVGNGGVKEGLCCVYSGHATGAVIVNEGADPNIGLDFLDALNELVVEGKWRHDRIDDNGAAHIKAAIVGPGEVIPISDGKLRLGRWQNVFFVDWDGPRERKVWVQVVGK